MPREYSFKIECKIDDRVMPAFDEICRILDKPRAVGSIGCALPRRRLPPGFNESDVPLGEWSWFDVGIEGEPPMIVQPTRLVRYQPQDGDGPAWIEYELWDRMPWVEPSE